VVAKGPDIVDMGKCRNDDKRTKLVLGLIVLVYLVLGALYATGTPAWQVPDEPAHYNYVRHVAEQAQLPELRSGDYPYAYLEEIKSRRFPPDMSIESIRYESHQPPLYYVIASPIYRMAGSYTESTRLLVLRLFSLILGAVSLLLGYKLVSTIYPREPLLALGAVAFAATLPMHLTMTAAVNNDVLTELLLHLTIWQLVLMKPGDWSRRRAFGLGVLLGLSFLTKMQSYVAIGLALVALVWDVAYLQPGGLFIWRKALERAGIMLGTALLIALPWLFRNSRLYGVNDLLGLVRHDQIVVGQLTTSQYISQSGVVALCRDFICTGFRSFWGQFGWMGVLLDQRIYSALVLLSGLVAIGLGFYVADLFGKRLTLPSQTKRGLALLVVWLFLTAVGFLWWNTKYVQHQGRYLFPALVPMGLGFTLGLRELLQRSPRAIYVLLGILIVGLLVAGIVTGGVKAFSVALLIGATISLQVGHCLERLKPGAALALAYAGMAVFALICLYAYIVPVLSP
jgi:4-amino-4-deoxy-L-arabinose transferase-like glycosyltransferase